MVEGDAAGVGALVVGLLYIERAGGEWYALVANLAVLAGVLRDDDMMSSGEHLCVRFCWDVERPDDIGGDVVDISPGGGSLEGEGGVGWDEEWGGVD